MTRVTRRYRFAASHRLQLDQKSTEENQELYGKCNNPYGHGHDYVLEVGVRGPIDGAAGQVINVLALDRLVQEQVIRDFDHRYLNSDINEFRKLVPTSENILRVVEDRLLAHWPAGWPRLELIRLRETARNLFELKASEQ